MKCHYLGYAGRQVAETRALLCYYAVCSGNFLLMRDNILVPSLGGSRIQKLLFTLHFNDSRQYVKQFESFSCQV